MRELELIEQIRRTFTATAYRGRAVALGIGDDCAILRPPSGSEVLVTTDFTLENRHFRRNLHSPESVGHRCLARGLSDLASMGAVPMAAFLSLAVPSDLLAKSQGRGWITRFFNGLQELAKLHSVGLAGGDTAESPADLILADIILLGSAPAGRSMRRSGAKPGDSLYVTGSLGGAAAELGAMLSGPARRTRAASLIGHPHLFPQPRIATGRTLLRRKLATACIDVSDGLSTDLFHLCRASGLAAEVERAAIPLHPLARRLEAEAALNTALHGGEDYELLFAASASVRMPREIEGVPITRIGRFIPKRTKQPLMALLAPDGSRATLEPQGWEHFSRH